MIRNHTTRFKDMHKVYHPSAHRTPPTAPSDTDSDITVSLIRPMSRNSPRNPFWVSEKQSIKISLDGAGRQLEKLKDLYRHAQLVGFDDDDAMALQSRVRTIEEEIMTKLRVCKKCLGKMSQPSKDEKETPAQATIRVSAFQGMLEKVTEFTSEFSRVRSEHQNRDKRLEARATENAAVNKIVSVSDDDDDDRDPGFTGDQVALLEDAERRVKERAEDIHAINRDMGVIHEIFVDMSLMVKDHGNMLDRIDYNIDTTVAHTAKALEENKQAENYQKSALKKYWALLVIALLVAITLGLIIVITVVKS